MLKQLVGSRLSTKQIVIFIVMALLAIYITWYVVEALEGLDPNYRPTGTGKLSDNNANQGAKGNDFFDPTKKTLEADSAK